MKLEFESFIIEDLHTTTTIKSDIKGNDMIRLSRAACLAVAVMLMNGLSGNAQAAGLTINTTGGVVQGISTSSTNKYLGIPYAAPPTGPLRWRAPQPASWSGVLQANTLPPICPQPAGPLGAASLNEDCLYLNVYAPSSGNNGLPVMVWIHGGAFKSGTGDTYDGTTLTQNGVIVVTLNYRLGYLGFLANPVLDEESSGGGSGDYGLMDQQAALLWVKANAKSFGGDPNRITVFGQSAGGQSVLDQLVSPTAAGLFQRAIIESGSYAFTLPSLANADAKGSAFAKAVGCSDASCLRALPVSAIVAQENPSSSISSPLGTQFQPNVGTAILPIQPLLGIASGAFNRVPVLQGTNHDEGRLFTAIDFDFKGAPLGASGYDSAIASVVNAALLPVVVPLYPPGAYPSLDIAFATLFTDATFSCTALSFNQLLSLNVPTYAYEFADENAARLSLPTDPFLPLDATHGSELPFLWANLIGTGIPAKASMTIAEQQLAVQMQAAWTSFAKSGTPNGPGVTQWPRFEAKTSLIHELVPPAPYSNSSFSSDHKCEVWEPLLALQALRSGSF